MTLEEILQEFFGCKKPFDRNGKLTKSGDYNVQRLIDLLGCLEGIGVINCAHNSARKIDEIIDDNY